MTEERRAALEIAVIKEDLSLMKAMARWVPHHKNPEDALTKHKGSHAAPLMRLLRDHRWTIMEEAKELEGMKEAREDLGYTPRPKQRMQLDDME